MRFWITIWSHFHLGIALTLWIHFAETRNYYGRGITKAPHCPTDYCSREYTKAMRNGLIKEDSHAYCQLIVQMLECVKQLVRYCPTNINVKSQLTGFSRENKTKNCAKYRISPYHRRSTCPSWSDHPGRPIPMCSFFGFEHLRIFGGQFETCTKIGTSTLVENPFFIIQVSTTMVTIKQGLEMPAVIKFHDQHSREYRFVADVSGGKISMSPPLRLSDEIYIVLLVKNLEGCLEGQRYYEALYEESNLPISFTDGTYNDSKMGITVHSGNHVDVHLYYLNSTVHFRRASKFLGVTVSVPWQLYHLSSENPHLCRNGCPVNNYLPLAQVLANPSDYVKQCTAIDYPLKTMDEASDHCKKIGTVDDFNAFCLFDHIIGDPLVAHMAYKIQLDVARSSHAYMSNETLLKSEAESPLITFDCVKPSMAAKVVPPLRLIGLSIAVYLYL